MRVWKQEVVCRCETTDATRAGAPSTMGRPRTEPTTVASSQAPSFPLILRVFASGYSMYPRGFECVAWSPLHALSASPGLTLVDRTASTGVMRTSTLGNIENGIFCEAAK